MNTKPIILIPCNTTPYSGAAGHVVRESYVNSVVNYIGALPLLLPALGNKINPDDLSENINGILLTGATSHLAPSCYGATQSFEDEKLDPARDATTLPLIRWALDRDMPLLAICRGFQELNVITGGTLHQAVHDIPGKIDHRADPLLKGEELYLKRAHKIVPQSGGLFDKWGIKEDFPVNTIHEHGIDKLGKGLHVEGISEDDLIEAISVPGKKFIFGVQWHPEGDAAVNPVSRQIFEEFGKVVRS